MIYDPLQHNRQPIVHEWVMQEFHKMLKTTVQSSKPTFWGSSLSTDVQVAPQEKYAISNVTLATN